MSAHLSFLDFLRSGELPPIRLGAARAEVLRLLGTPTSWVSKDDPLFQPPRRDYRTSDSISFGTLTFSFDANDCVEHIMLSPSSEDGECVYPPGSLYFPGRTTSVHEVADLMRSHGIPFEDISHNRDGSELKAASGIVVLMSQSREHNGAIFYCGPGPRKNDTGIEAKQLYRDSNDIVERFRNSSFEDMIAAFGPPIEDRAATATTGRMLVFGNVTDTIQCLVVQQLPNGKFEFRFQAAKITDDTRPVA